MGGRGGDALRPDKMAPSGGYPGRVAWAVSPQPIFGTPRLDGVCSCVVCRKV